MLFFGFLFLRYLLGTSFLVISNTTNEWVVVDVSADGNFEEKIELNEGETKELKLTAGRYTVTASSKNKASIYSAKPSNYWSKSKVDIELFEPKASSFLGSNELKCAREIDGKPVYYACESSDPGTLDAPTIKNASPLPKLEEELIPTPEGLLEPAINISLKPYRDGFLEAKKKDQNLYVSKRDAFGYMKGSKIKIEDFGPEINDDTFSVSGSAGIYAVLDKQKNRIVYGNVDNKEQKFIDLAQEKINYDLSEVIIKASKNKIFVLVFFTQEHVESETDEGHVDTEVDPKIIVYDIQNAKIDKKLKFEENSLVYGVSSGPGGLIYLSTANKGSASLVNENTEETPLAGFGVNTRKPCWINEDIFYYQSEDGSAIYKYLVDKEAAYLVYQNYSSDSFIENISCTDGSLYFAVNSKRDGELRTYNHFNLSDISQIGTPIEQVLPRYFDIGRQSFKASLSSSGGGAVKVELIYNGSGQTVNKKQVSKVLLDDLAFENIHTSELKVEFGF
ncbi:hypothetical protein KY385_04390 [Candidatus Parcubacteria bacterium]|nr:hypothetical protein [Candidatus Parcubacteria bacterium]